MSSTSKLTKAGTLEVDIALRSCAGRRNHDDYLRIKQRLADGTARIVDDQENWTHEADGVLSVRADHWEKHLAVGAMREEAEFHPLSERELGRFEGAIAALLWVQGDNEYEPLYSFLTSDKFGKSWKA